MKKGIVLVILFLMLFSLIFPICLAIPTLQVNDFNTSLWPEVTVDCAITDFTDDINPEFEIVIDDKDYPSTSIERIENYGKSINVLFLVDISGSMKYAFENIKEKMSRIADLFQENDTFSMITFADDLETVVSFSDNPVMVGLKMGEQKAKGGTTRFFDVMIEANEFLKTRNNDGVIFLFSDGIDDGSIATEPIKTDYPIIPIIPEGRGIEKSLLETLANQTDGFFMSSFDLNSIKPSIIKWKGISGTGFRIKIKGLPEYEPPIEQEITFQATITREIILKYPYTLVIEKPQNPWWIWILVGIGGLTALTLGVLRFFRLRVPQGKVTKQKRLKGNIHYIAWLSVAGSNKGQTRIRTNLVTIGSNPDSTLHIDDPTVSAKHAIITETTEGYIISDEGSTNGIFVNEESIQGKQVLINGDRIRLGKAVIEFTQSDFTYMSDKKVI